MQKKILGYMLSNDPKETISKEGIDRRRKINPIFLKALALTNPLKLKIEKKEKVPTDKPIIYVATHAFKDDALNTLVTIDDLAYVLTGNLDLFFNTFDGLCLWINGAVLVDRFDSESKAASKEKMEALINEYVNLLIFAEATWNLSDNTLIYNLYGGFYDLAKNSDALVCPVITHRVGKKCYSILGKPYDVADFSKSELTEIIKDMQAMIIKALDLMIYKNSVNAQLYEELQALKNEIEQTIENLDNYSEESLSDSIDAIENKARSLLTYLRGLNSKEKYEDKYTDKFASIEILMSIEERIGNLLKAIANSKKKYASVKLRDILARGKYELYSKYSNYSDVDRESLERKKSLAEQWDKTKKKLIKQTKYFYPVEEASIAYKDPLIYEPEEVFPKLTLRR